MNLDELKKAVAERWGAQVFVEPSREGGKALVQCGIVIPGSPRKKRLVKSIVFNQAAIPDNAVEKIARVIE